MAVADCSRCDGHTQQALHCIQQLCSHLIIRMPACLPAQAQAPRRQLHAGVLQGWFTPNTSACLVSGQRKGALSDLAHNIKQVQHGDFKFPGTYKNAL